MSNETAMYLAYFMVYVLPILFIIVTFLYIYERRFRKDLESYRVGDESTIYFWRNAYKEEVEFNNSMFSLTREPITDPDESTKKEEETNP